MRRAAQVVVIAAVMFLGNVYEAEALWKIFGWLDEMSGPGEFEGPVVLFEVFCSPLHGRKQVGDLVQAVSEMITARDDLAARESDLAVAEKARDELRLKVKGLVGTPEATERLLREAETRVMSLATVASAAKSRLEAARNLQTARTAALVGCRVDRSNVRYAVVVEAGWWKEKRDNPRYDGDTSLRSLVAIAYAPVPSMTRAMALTANDNTKDAIAHRLRWLRGVEFGVGLGVYRMTGTAVQDRDYWRAAVPLRARFRLSEFGPLSGDNAGRLRRLLGAVQFRIGWDYIPGTLPARAFRLTDAVVPARISKREAVGTMGLTVDAGVLIAALRHRKAPID